MKLKPKRSVTNILEPRPVHPRAVLEHGLFGKVFVKQHMFIDDLWTPKELKRQFERMAKLLEMRLRFSRPDKIATRKNMLMQSHNLRRQCQEGRTKLKLITAGDPTGVRNLLQNHKEMQRLYQQLPTYMVENKINQRTFAMRKEQDRLRFQMDDLKKTYCAKSLQLNDIQNRLQFENEFILDEEIRCYDLEKKLRDANTRLKAVKMIHTAYAKILHVLRYDAIFYESILKSLDRDVQDQGEFIKHILFLGSPAIRRFKILEEEYRLKDDANRKSTREQIKECAHYFEQGETIRRKTLIRDRRSKMFDQGYDRRYERETYSMQNLQHDMEDVEDAIKKIKYATLTCSAKDIMSRVRNQNDMNHKINKVIETGEIVYNTMETKEKYSTVFQEVVTHGHDAQGVKHIARVKELEEAVKTEDKLQEETLDHIKNRSDVFVMVRFALWNINEIMHYVAKQRCMRRHYPTDDLKLPLLNFELLNSFSVAPDAYPDDVESLLDTATNKLRLLLGFLKGKLLSKEDTDDNRDIYCKRMIEDQTNGSKEQVSFEREEASGDEADGATKLIMNVPDRKRIKMESARVVDEVIKAA